MNLVAGLDLGQQADYTALVICERQDGKPSSYDVRHIQRYRLGTPYPAIVQDLTQKMASPALKGMRLVVDATGVGLAVIDLLGHLSPVAVSITGGDKATCQRGRWRVPKRDLVAVTKVLLQADRLRFAEGLPETAALAKELLNFQVRIDPRTAHDSYAAWREGSHDDLVLALALALWWGERGHGVYVSWFDVPEDEPVISQETEFSRRFMRGDPV